MLLNRINTPRFKPRICDICGQSYDPTGSYQKICGSTKCTKLQRRDWAKKWYQKNPEKTKEYSRKKYQKNPEKERSRSTKWRQENPEKVKASYKKWKQKNIEKIKVYHRKWWQENRKKSSA